MSTTSLQFPNMLDPSRNRVNVLEGSKSVVNRTRLLMLTDPTEMYYSPTFGVGLKKFLWQYNNENVRALMKDRIVDQLRDFEPCVVAEETSFSDSLISEGDMPSVSQEYNQVKLTVGLKTIYQDEASVIFDTSEDVVKFRSYAERLLGTSR